MKKKYFLLIVFCFQNICPAIFTIQNYTGKDIMVEVFLNKSWGSKSMIANIADGAAYTFDTGVYGVIPEGIRWDGGRYYLEKENPNDQYQFSISPLSIGVVIRLFKNSYEYMHTKSLRGLAGGGYQQGSGPISRVY